MGAQATVGFIEAVGFEKSTREAPESLGRLKNVTFVYDKQDVNGNIISDEITLPLLSLVPIPLLQIKDASLEFNLRLTEITKAPLTQNGNRLASIPPIVIMKGTYGKIVSGGEVPKSDTDLKIKMNIVQSDIPVGLSRLFQILDIAVHGKVISQQTRME